MSPGGRNSWRGSLSGAYPSASAFQQDNSMVSERGLRCPRAIEWLQFAISRGDERVLISDAIHIHGTLQGDARFESRLGSIEARRS
jgi:hypothetical protein